MLKCRDTWFMPFYKWVENGWVELASFYAIYYKNTKIYHNKYRVHLFYCFVNRKHILSEK